MSFQITHVKTAVDYTGAGTPSASQILSAANWNQTHFTLSAGSGIAVNSDGASPPNITIALSGSSTSSSGGNIVGNGTNPFLAMFKSQTSVGSSIFQDDGTALKATTDNTSDLGTLALRYRSIYVGTTISGGTGSFSSIGVGTVNTTTLITNQSQTLLPTTDNTYPLGSLNQRWSNLFVAGTVSGGTANFSTGGFNSITGVTGSITSISANSVGTTLFNANTGSITTLTSTTLSGGTASVSSIGVGTVNAITLITNQAQTLLPTTDNTYNIGSIPQRWANLYAATAVSGGAGSFSSIGSGSISSTVISANSSGAAQSNAGIGSITTFTATTISGGSASLSTIGVGTINATTLITNQSQTILPTTDNTYNLGSVPQRWASIFAATAISGGTGSFSTIGASTINGTSASFNSLTVGGTSTLTGTSTTGQINPSSDATFPLGTTVLRWTNIFASAIVSAGEVDVGITKGGTGTFTSITTNTSTFNGIATYNSNVVPGSDNTYNLGTLSTARWANLYVGTAVSGGTGSFSTIGVGVANIATLNANSSTIPTLSTTSIGTTNFNASVGSITTFTATTVSGGSASLSSIGVGTVNATTLITNQSQTILPTTDNTYNLGSSILRWATVYGLTFSGVGSTLALVGQNNTINWDGTAFQPATDNARDLGTSSLRWRNAYVAGTVSVGTNGSGGFLTQLGTNDVELSSGSSPNNLVLLSNNHLVAQAATLRPDVDNARDLGTSTQRWRDLYIGRSIGVGLAADGTTGDIRGTGTTSAGSGFQTNNNPVESWGGPAVTTVTSVGGQIDKVRVIVNGVARWIALYDS